MISIEMIIVRKREDMLTCLNDGQTIYATNGWRDFNINLTDNTSTIGWGENSIMYCGQETSPGTWEYRCDLTGSLAVCDPTSIPDGNICDNPPSKSPTKDPTTEPTNPTEPPTNEPTSYPTKDPSIEPTVQPSLSPVTDSPTTANPTVSPSFEPTIEPTMEPTSSPTKDPLSNPTINPTNEPTSDPTNDPSYDPTVDPSANPSSNPTAEPSSNPTIEPTLNPTIDPTIEPTNDPSLNPTTDPTINPIQNPTSDPTNDPSLYPTSDPTTDPTNDPSLGPTADHHSTSNPTMDYTADPSTDPTSNPTVDPTYQPTLPPTEPCDDWTIGIEVTIFNSQDNSFKTQQELWNLCLLTFRLVLYSNQSDVDWCVQIFDIQFTLKIGSIDLLCEYQMNNKLYNDYFIDYNESDFLADFVTELQQNVTNITISDPNSIPSPTIAPTNTEETDSDETDSDALTLIINDFQIIIYAVILFFILLIVVSTVYSRRIKKNDFYSYSALIAVGIHFNDTLSDVFFCINISSHDEYPSSELSLMLYLSMTFIILPASITICQLYYQIKEWKRNVELSQWLASNIRFLYFSSVLLGSSFVSIKLCTSNLFNLGLFDMPLSKSQSIQYQTKSIYSTIMFEVTYINISISDRTVLIIISRYMIYSQNLPQLTIQAWFLISYSSDINAVVYASIIFSGLSLLITALSIVSQRDILQSQDYLSIEFDVTGGMKKIKHHRNRIKPIKAGIASTLGLSNKLLEITRPMPIKNGLRLKINIYVNNINTDNMNIQEDFNLASENGQIIKLIMSGWKLNSNPHLSNIKYMKHESRERQTNTMTPKIDTQIELNSMSHTQHQNETDPYTGTVDFNADSIPKSADDEGDTAIATGEYNQDFEQPAANEQNASIKEVSEKPNDGSETENYPTLGLGMNKENAHSAYENDGFHKSGINPSNGISMDTALLNALWDEKNNDKYEGV